MITPLKILTGLVAGLLFPVAMALAEDIPTWTVGYTLQVEFEKSATDPCQTNFRTLSLGLNGLDTDLHAVGCHNPKTGRSYLIFPLARGEVQGPSADVTWGRIVGNPWQAKDDNFMRRFDVSLYGAGASEITLVTTRIQLNLIQRGLALLGLAIVFVAWAGLFVAGRKSDMLRDSNFTAGSGRRPFSLGRVQMGWWFGLVFGGYVFLWVMTLEWHQLNTSALILLGISGGASLTATGIDLPPERGMPPSVSFLHDILTDAQGVTLARLQMLLWNVALGIFFVVKLFTDLRMPDFDATTLGVLGISAGAYLGFKVPEKQTSEVAKDVQKDAGNTIDDPKTNYGADTQRQTAQPTEDPKAGYAPH